MNSVWKKLARPIFSLAPMEDVTDTVFRQIICLTGRPAVSYTEFTNVDGIESQGREIVARRLLFSPIEKPLIAQIWGLRPENFYKASKELVEMGFDGIDINMGCPQKDVIQHGTCSALIKNHNLTKEIIQAVKEGAKILKHPRGVDNSSVVPHLGGESSLPVSVKTRIGFKKIQTEEWIGFLLEQNLDVVTIHGRTAAEMSKVPAHWDEIGRAVKLRNEWEDKQKTVIPAEAGTQEKFETRVPPEAGRQAGMTIPHTLIFGNGDVQSLREAKEKVKQYGVDGVMIGRGIFHNPWLFNEKIDITKKTLQERLELLEKHVSLFEKIWQEKKSFQILKKYFKIYLSDFEGASEVRQKFMETNSYKEALELVNSMKIQNIPDLSNYSKSEME